MAKYYNTFILSSGNGLYYSSDFINSFVLTSAQNQTVEITSYNYNLPVDGYDDSPLVP